MQVEITNFTKSQINKSHVLKVIETMLKKKKIKRDLSIVFVSGSEMKKINKEFRNKNEVTDVLSFPDTDKKNLGEIVICPQKIKADAINLDIKTAQALEVGLVHAILHLLGFLHGTKRQASLMENEEKRIHQALRS